MGQIACPNCGHLCEFSRKNCEICSAILYWVKFYPNTVETLSISEGADFREFMKDVFGEIDSYLPSIEAVRWALNKLTRQPRRIDQVYIRYYDLDGKGRRTKTQIAREFGKSLTAISQALEGGKRRLRHPAVSRVLFGKIAVPTE